MILKSLNCLKSICNWAHNARLLEHPVPYPRRHEFNDVLEVKLLVKRCVAKRHRGTDLCCGLAKRIQRGGVINTEIKRDLLQVQLLLKTNGVILGATPSVLQSQVSTSVYSYLKDICLLHFIISSDNKLKPHEKTKKIPTLPASGQIFKNSHSSGISFPVHNNPTFRGYIRGDCWPQRGAATGQMIPCCETTV